MSTKSIPGKPKAVTAKTTVARKPDASRPVAAKPASTATTAKPEKKNKKLKSAKVKVVRDSFTMPQNDYAKIGELKQVCLKAGLQVKKSELLRAGLHALSKLSATQLKLAIAQIEQVKTGRPKKD